jgi:hypothetical protein
VWAHGVFKVSLSGCFGKSVTTRGLIIGPAQWQIIDTIDLLVDDRFLIDSRTQYRIPITPQLLNQQSQDLMGPENSRWP